MAFNKNLDGTVLYIVKVNATNDIQKQIIDHILGQMSDGYWEGKASMTKYWRQIDYDKQNDYIVVYDNPKVRGRADFGMKTIGQWFAWKIKFIAKQCCDDYNVKGFSGKWDKYDEQTKISYLSHPIDVTIKDVHETCDVLEKLTLNNYEYQ